MANSRTGVTVKDVDTVFSKTRHTTCISPSLGGSGNPSVITARGIVCAIKVLLSPRYFIRNTQRGVRVCF